MKNCPRCQDPIGDANVCTACGWKAPTEGDIDLNSGEAGLLINCGRAIGALFHSINKNIPAQHCNNIALGILIDYPPQSEPQVALRSTFKKVLLVASPYVPNRMDLYIFLQTPDGQSAPVYTQIEADMEMLPLAPSIYPVRNTYTWLLYPHTMECNCDPSNRDSDGVCKACGGLKQVKSLFGHRGLPKFMDSLADPPTEPARPEA